jgi:hypothetical protein
MLAKVLSIGFFEEDGVLYYWKRKGVLATRGVHSESQAQVAGPDSGSNAAEAMIYTHVLRQGGSGTRSPLDCL